jgi:hypothetical protein
MAQWWHKQGLWAVVVIAGLLLILGPMSLLAAQDAEPFGGLTAIAQAAPTGQGAQSNPEVSGFAFLAYGGAFQLLDNAGGVCTGQCAVINPQTGDCSCPSGYIADAAARILTDAAGGGFTCGSVLYICGK